MTSTQSRLPTLAPRLFRRFVRRAIFLAIFAAIAYASWLEGPPGGQPRSGVSLPVGASRVMGRIVRIADGDTLQLLAEKEITVRLDGIDAPELGQPFGDAARRHLAELCDGKNVTVDVSGEDQFGRTLGVVNVAGEDINAAMVRDGFAWRYLHSESDELARLEAEAKSERRGLWQDREPTPPWDWRREYPRSDR